MYQRQLEEYIENHIDEMLEDVKKLVRIDSTRGEKKEGKPFGEGPAEALAAAEEMMRQYGFITKNYDNYVVTGDISEDEKGLDILAHLDVVPVTPDWTVTSPFDPVVQDGKIYGRGTSDDKGPAVAALYAMRAIKESGVPLKRNVRLILGADEECGSSDLEYYYGIEKEAPMSFSPDADYPVINLEKGRLEAVFERNFSESEKVFPAVLEIKGGDTVNVVPAKASAVVKGIAKDELQEEIQRDTCGVKFELEEEDDRIIIYAKGTAGHASLPETGQNAISALLGLLARLPFAESERTSAIRAMARMFPYGDMGGEALEVSMEDEISGRLTMNLGVISLEENHFEAAIDSRIPVCGDDKNVADMVRNCVNKNGFEMTASSLTKSHYVPADSAFVKTLVESYEKYSGQKGEVRGIGGSTYVHELECGVAFGCAMDDVDNHMHGDDEFMVVDVLVMSAKIFADVICRLCC
ncbi:MAG: Sapep family Mn(2+)-dependent dipeptidase [Eubacteriales bacterium]|nr:Sapep family Mn(2+)-dependent dipeptidase [Eubacteriales bacterium]